MTDRKHAAVEARERQGQIWQLGLQSFPHSGSCQQREAALPLNCHVAMIREHRYRVTSPIRGRKVATCDNDVLNA